MGYNLTIPHLSVGYNPVTNHLLDSWDILSKAMFRGQTWPSIFITIGPNRSLWSLQMVPDAHPRIQIGSGNGYRLSVGPRTTLHDLHEKMDGNHQTSIYSKLVVSCRVLGWTFRICFWNFLDSFQGAIFRFTVKIYHL